MRKEAFTDAELIDNLRSGSGDAAVIRFLYRQHFDFLNRYVVANSGTNQDAEDIFQEVIIAFINLAKAGRFRGESSVKTFLYSLNKNMWLNELKRKRRAMAREEKYDKENKQQDLLADAAMEMAQSRSELMDALSDLGENCKKILLLFYFESKSMKDILEHLPYENEQVVRNKKSKCLKKLVALISAKPDLYHRLKSFVHG